MNEVGGSESGTGLRAIKSSRSSDANFEYDDSEWDVGIGNLIIDLDADIEKNNEANRINNNSSNNNLSSTTGGLSNTSPSNNNNFSSPNSGSSNPQMHIPLSSSGNSSNNSSGSGNKPGKASGANSNNNKSSLGKGSTNNTSSATDLSGVMEHSSVVDKGLKMKIKRTKTGTKSGADAKHEIVKNDVVGSANGTSSASSGSNSSGYSSNNKSIADSITAKNSHTSAASHKDKDKLSLKDSLLHDNSHDSESINYSTSGNTKQDVPGPGDQGGKVKTPRKASTKEKKVKNNCNNNSGNNKKDDKTADSKGLSNSGNNASSSASGTHAKDNKEFFSTTVNLNVPNVIPNSSSSAFVKATATIKVPTVPISSAASVLSSSASSSLNVHSSGDSSSSSNSRSQNLSSNNTTNSTSTPWGTLSPTKGANKGRLSPSVENLSNSADKTGNSYKKARNFAAADKSAAPQDENSPASSLVGPPGSSTTSYRNQGALSINSPTDLSTSSSNFILGSTTALPGNTGSSFNSSKETGKGVRTPPSVSTPTTADVCVGTSVGTLTEPDSMEPCEPGTSVTLEGIVWRETENGVLVVNVTWRGRTYVGTLLDCTKNDWAAPRFCDSPTSDLEMRTPKNRGKRGRAQTATPVNEPVVADTRSANAKLRNGAKGRRGSNTTAAFVAPASPVKPDPWPKRKTRGSENETQEDTNPKNAKRPKVSKDAERKERRSNSPAADSKKSGPASPQLIECPEPNCFKKYTHINGLKYHQSHAHSNNFVAAEDSDSNMSTASNTTTPAPEPTNLSSSTESTVEPMVVDSVPEVSAEPIPVVPATAPSPPSVPEDTPVASPTPAKKITAPIVPIKVEEKAYDLSTESEPIVKIEVQTPENVESYKAKGAANKVPPQSKESNSTASEDTKLTPENLSKDSLATTISTPTVTVPTPTPTLTPRTPILTVPVVPYMSSLNRKLVHGHVVNVPRIDSLNSRESENSSNPGISPVPMSKNAPWQPHAHSQSQSSLSNLGSHVVNTSPTHITVPLNIPMNIPEKLGGGKDKDKNNSDHFSKKNKHKKKSKDKDRERDGKSKNGDKDRHDGGKGMGVSLSGASDYSRTGMFHNSNLGSDVPGSRSKDMSGEDSDKSRKNSMENREDPQSPAYSDISDANDSGPDNELNVGSTIKDNCKGLVIPGEIKKDTINVPGVTGGPPLSFFNHSFYSPYLDTPSNPPNSVQRQTKEGPSAEEVDKNRLPSTKHPALPPNPPIPPTTMGNEEARRSPKIDFHPHSKYPFPNYFSYPYTGYHYDHPSFPNTNMVPENSFNPPGPGRMFPGMDDREKETGPSIDSRMGNQNQSKNCKPGDKDESVGGVQIKQEPIEREERRGKERSQGSSMSMNLNEDKGVEIKSEFGSDRDHSEHKLVPPYMSNSSSKHMSKEHKRDREDRHERRHDSKENDSKSDNMKSGRSSSSADKMMSKGAMEDSEMKERKDEGSKPTMETTGPPPPPTASAYYLPQSYLPGNPFGLPFDPSHPLYRQVLVPGPYPASPYMHHGSIPRFPPTGGPTPLPEDLSRPSPTGPGNPSKALDLLQHHAAQYYSAHKIHELQERALKSPSPQVTANQRDRDINVTGPGSNLPPTSSPGGHQLGGPGVNHSMGGRSSVGGTSVNSSMPKPADLSKDAKPIIGAGGSILPGGPNSDNVRTTPPTQHHVHSHTHHHTHVGIGYPIIPTVPPQYSPHYGVLGTSPSAPSVIPPFASQKPN